MAPCSSCSLMPTVIDIPLDPDCYPKLTVKIFILVHLR